MPTVLRIGGWRFVIFANDHRPAHVHVLGPGWSVVVTIAGRVAVREVLGASALQTRRVLELAERHQDSLRAAWEKMHG